jgi:hypothetical protein
MRANNVRRDCSSVVPKDIRKLQGKRRVYFLVENRSAASIFMQYDSVPRSDGSDGIEIVAGFKYELFGVHAPNNDVIWLTGSVATVQQVNVTEGYES